MTKNKFSFMAMILAIFISFGVVGGASSVEVLAVDKLPYQDVQTDKAQKPETAVKDGTAIGSIVNTMYTFAKYISGLIFGVAVIMIVWAGFKYATSQGETKVTEQAKMQIITAGIGIGVALLAMIITKVFVEIFGTAQA